MSMHTLNGRRDLAMDGELRRYIGTQVDFIRFTRGGLAYCKTNDGKFISVPRANLDPRPTEGKEAKP